MGKVGQEMGAGGGILCPGEAILNTWQPVLIKGIIPKTK